MFLFHVAHNFTQEDGYPPRNSFDVTRQTLVAYETTGGKRRKPSKRFCRQNTSVHELHHRATFCEMPKQKVRFRVVFCQWNLFCPKGRELHRSRWKSHWEVLVPLHADCRVRSCKEERCVHRLKAKVAGQRITFALSRPWWKVESGRTHTDVTVVMFWLRGVTLVSVQPVKNKASPVVHSMQFGLSWLSRWTTTICFLTEDFHQVTCALDLHLAADCLSVFYWRCSPGAGS